MGRWRDRPPIPPVRRWAVADWRLRRSGRVGAPSHRHPDGGTPQ